MIMRNVIVVRSVRSSKEFYCGQHDLTFIVLLVSKTLKFGIYSVFELDPGPGLNLSIRKVKRFVLVPAR
jgi:hypothetical protein